MTISLVRLHAQIFKELLSVLRDPRSRFVLIAPPLMQLLIFSFAATLDVNRADLAVLNRDGGPVAHEFVSQLAAASFVNEIRYLHSAPEAQAMLDKREVLAVIDIPQSFSSDHAGSRSPAIQLIVDGRRPNAGQIVQGYLTELAIRVNATVESRSIDADPVAVRHWFNPNLTYRWFIVPSLSGILSTFIALLVTSLSIARERELGTFDQLLVSPSTTIEIIIAKTVPALAIGTALGLVMISAAIVVFAVPFHGSFLVLLLSLMLFILSMVGIGLMISSVCSTQQQAILGTFAIGVPTVLLSGFATPVENMPVALQWIAQAIPLKHYLVIVQGSFMKALPVGDVFANAWPMALIAATTLSAATLLVRSKLQ